MEQHRRFYLPSRSCKVESYAHTARIRVKILRKAIFEQPEVRKVFLDDDELIPGFLVEGISLKIRKELYILRREIPLLGQFDVTTSLVEVNVKDLYTQVRSKAPTLWRFFRSVISQPEDDAAKDERSGSFALIAALLCHALAPTLGSSSKRIWAFSSILWVAGEVLLKFFIP
jgi:hypothetical protein